MTFVISGAKAVPVCFEEDAVYELAQADKDGTGEAVWQKLKTDKRCTEVAEATYLLTLQEYMSDVPTYVVVYLAMGYRMYGLTTNLPPWVHKI